MIRKPRIIIALAMCLLAVLYIIPYSGAAAQGVTAPFGTKMIYNGDANLDGVIDDDDALFILNYLSGSGRFISDTHRSIADANWDGVVDIDDAILILEEGVIQRYRTAYRIGDVNLDGIIDAKDANLLLSNLNGQASWRGNFAITLADCNADGVIDINDVLAILDYLSS
jgi:hypothetical protein